MTKLLVKSIWGGSRAGVHGSYMVLGIFHV